MQITGMGLALCCAVALTTAGCGDDDGGSGGSGASSSGGSSSGGSASGGSGTGGSSTGGSAAGGGGTSGPCAATACSEMEPDAACETCVEAECAAEITACLGDATDPAANCIGCADILGDGSFDEACAASKTLFADFLECICGDGTTAGKCG